MDYYTPLNSHSLEISFTSSYATSHPLDGFLLALHPSLVPMDDHYIDFFIITHTDHYTSMWSTCEFLLSLVPKDGIHMPSLKVILIPSHFIIFTLVLPSSIHIILTPSGLNWCFKCYFLLPKPHSMLILVSFFQFIHNYHIRDGHSHTFSCISLHIVYSHLESYLNLQPDQFIVHLNITSKIKILIPIRPFCLYLHLFLH